MRSAAWKMLSGIAAVDLSDSGWVEDSLRVTIIEKRFGNLHTSVRSLFFIYHTGRSITSQNTEYFDCGRYESR